MIARRGPLSWGRLASSLLGVCLIVSQGLQPVCAADDYAIASSRAAHGLMLDVVQAGRRLVAVGERGHILHSADQGLTWQQARVPTRQLLTALYFVDGQHGWAVGHDAVILATSDGGLSWRKQHEDPDREAPLLDVWFQDVDDGFAIGAYGLVLQTRDGGQTWKEVSERLPNDDQYHLNGIAMIPDGGLFVVGEQGSLYRSADAGATWTAVPSPYTGSWFGVIDTGQPRTLLIYGLRGSLYRSEDFGDSWQPVEVSDAQGVLASGLAGAARLDSGEILLVGNAGSVLRSRDQGHRFSLYRRADRRALAGVTAAGPDRWVLAGQGGLERVDGDGAPVAP